MKKNKITLKQVGYLGLLVFYICVGIFVILYAALPTDYNSKIMGLMVLLSSIVHILLYFLTEGYKRPEKGFFLVIGIIAFSLGIVFLTTKVMTIPEICLYWGILDIVRSSLEIKDVIPELKENKIEIVELVISFGDIVLGILLCVHLEEGIQLHLYYFGAAFILSAIKYILHGLITTRKSNDSNKTDSKNESL